MNRLTSRRRGWAVLLAAVSAVLTMVFAFGPAAHAMSYTYTTNTWVPGSDSNGVSGGAWIENADDTDQYIAIVKFHAYGERLEVWDTYQDGHLAHANVEVYDTSGSLVDTDTFETGDYTTDYNLGTPDGSGNIPDGYQVRIRVCVTGDWYCSAWVTSKA